MQDILTEASLSAGAVYRYFPGKDQIISAIAGSVFDRFLVLLGEPGDEEPAPALGDLVDGLFAIVDRLQRDQQVPAIALQAWAESLRDPTLARLFYREIANITAHLQRVIEGSQRAGAIRDTLPPGAVASSVLLMVHGYLVQRVALGEEVSEQARAGIRALLDTPRQEPRRPTGA